jgi:ATP-dependent DNA helicase DinG
LGAVIGEAITQLQRLRELLGQRVRQDNDTNDERPPALDRVRNRINHLIDDLHALQDATENDVVWVDTINSSPVITLSPVDVGPILSSLLFADTNAVLTSATIPMAFPEVIGLSELAHKTLELESPFDYEHHALLYMAADLPTPKDPRFFDASCDRITQLIRASCGRALVLFTSWRAMERTYNELFSRLSEPLLLQGALPKSMLLKRFSEEETTSLFATMSYWQGVDVPGPSCSLVIIDRLPFVRPDDPLFLAKRESVGTQAFYKVDVPHAATLLAQGVGRLIRTATDRGVVALLDPRIQTKGYGKALLSKLPPMKRSTTLSDAKALLSDIVHDATTRLKGPLSI